MSTLLEFRHAPCDRLLAVPILLVRMDRTMMICRSCDEPVGAAHLDTCPLKMTQPFLGHIVSVFECVRVPNVNPAQRKDDVK